MAEIKIPFNKWSVEKLSDNKKNATSRYKKYGNVGDTFKVNLVEYYINLVVKLPLWFIRWHLHESEGCDSGDEFEDVWIKIHPRKDFRHDDEVWYHHFTESGN